MLRNKMIDSSGLRNLGLQSWEAGQNLCRNHRSRCEERHLCKSVNKNKPRNYCLEWKRWPANVPWSV